jgi:hypothetical protein
LPLLARVKIDQMEVKAAARVTHFALADLVAGRSLSDASVQMTADVNGMSFSGSGALADIPGHFSGTMDFRPGPPGGIVQRIVARTRTGIASLAGLGLDAAGLASGDVGLTALYQRRRDKTAWVDLRAELGATVLRLGVLGWRKPAGTPGAATARLVLDKAGRLAAIDDIDASGAGFAVRGEARLGAGGAAWIGLERVVLGNSQARGALAIGPGGKGVRVSLSGPVIDLGEWFQGEGRLGSSAAGSGAWVINARFARALLAQGRPLFNVALQASGVGATPRGLSLHAETAPARPVQVRLIPERTGRALFVSAADGGAVLRDLGVLGDIESGKLHVEGRFEDDRAGHPLRGIAELDEFRLRGAPLLGKALQAASLYGLLQALDGPGMNFNHLVAPFAYAQGIITLARARAFNPSLGLTAEGQIDLNAARLRLEGTIVPAYYLNTLPGRLPLIGPLFSPEKGGGLIAVRYVASGPLADPAISVNPLAALTPGLLRGLFGR